MILIALVSLIAGGLRFEQCEAELDTRLTQAIVAVHAPEEHPEVRIKCEAGGTVRVQTQRVTSAVDIGDIKPALRPQLVALSVLGTLADLKTLPPLVQGQSEKRLKAAKISTIVLASAAAAFVSIGLGFLIASTVANDAYMRSIGVGFLSAGAAGVLPGVGIALGFWLSESQKPKLAW